MVYNDYQIITNMAKGESHPLTYIKVNNNSYTVENTVSTEQHGVIYVCEGGNLFAQQVENDEHVLVKYDIEGVIKTLSDSISGVLTVIQFFQQLHDALHDAMHAAEEAEEEIVPEGEPSY